LAEFGNVAPDHQIEAGRAPVSVIKVAHAAPNSVRHRSGILLDRTGYIPHS
jgi:hypothetical protein